MLFLTFLNQKYSKIITHGIHKIQLNTWYYCKTFQLHLPLLLVHFSAWEDFLYELVEMPDLASKPWFLEDFWVAANVALKMERFGEDERLYWLVVSNIFLIVHPENWVFLMIHFDELAFFFQMGWWFNHQLDEISLPSPKLTIWHLFKWMILLEDDEIFLFLLGRKRPIFWMEGFLGSKIFKGWPSRSMWMWTYGVRESQEISVGELIPSAGRGFWVVG